MVMDMFIILIVAMVSPVFTDIKMYHITNFKYVQFIGYQLYFNKAVKNRMNNVVNHSIFCNNKKLETKFLLIGNITQQLKLQLYMYIH